jgi:putative peptidoglycan lipid II flippase
MEPSSAPATSTHVVERHGGLLRRTIVVSAMTLASRVLGFVREVMAAVLFGATSAVFDAFVTAWRIPNLLRRLFGEGALATSLQTALTDVDAQSGDRAGRELFESTLRLTVGVLSGVCLLMWGGAVALREPLVASGLLGEPVGARVALDLVVLMLPFLLFVCVAALCAGALQVRGRFTSTNVAPIAMNVVWIAALGAMIALQPSAEHGLLVRQLSVVVCVAGLVQLLVQLPSCVRVGLLGASVLRPFAPLVPGAWRVLTSALPLAIGAAVYQVNVMIDGLMAESLLSDGGPTTIYYAIRVQQFPMALVATAATAAVFPKLKALAATRQDGDLRRLHDRAQLGVAFLALPASAGLFVLAEPIAIALFRHGAFDTAGAVRLGESLAVLSLALLPAGAVGLASRVYYAKGDFKTPVRISIVALVLNTLLNYALVAGLHMDVAGLALGTVLASVVNLALLWPGLRSRLALPAGEAGFAGRFARIAAASALCAAAAWGAAAACAALPAAVVVAAGSLTGGLVFFGAAKLLRVEELEEFLAKLRARANRR